VTKFFPIIFLLLITGCATNKFEPVCQNLKVPSSIPENAALRINGTDIKADKNGQILLENYVTAREQSLSIKNVCESK
jgi:hypothetical protein